MISPAMLLESFLRWMSSHAVTNTFLIAIALVFVYALYCNRRGKHKGFVHYAPNLLTTLGILGTFVGIVIGLLDFNVNDIDGSIGTLLAGLKTAFITSLAGMAFAIVFKVIDSGGFFRPAQEKELPESVGPEEIHAELRAQRLATEGLAAAIVGDEDGTLISQIRLLRSDHRDDASEMKALLKEQVGHLGTLAEAAKVQDERFLEFRAGLWQKLDEFAEMMSKSATEQVIEALREVITDFNKNLTEQFGENFRQLNEAVAKLVVWQENYRVQLNEMREQYAHGVQAITQTESSVAHISEESKQIPVAMGELRTVLDATQHQLAELERHLEAFRDMRDKAVEAVPQIQGQMDAMVKDVSAAVKDAGEQIMSGSQQVQKSLVEGAQEFSERVQQTNAAMTSASTDLANNSEQIRAQLEDTFKDVNEHSRSMIQSLADSNDMVASNIMESQQKADDALQQMQMRLESAMEQVYQAQTNAMQRSFNAVEDELRSTAARTGEVVTRQLEAMDTAMQDELIRVMNELGTHLATITGRFTEDYQSLTGQMAQVVGQARRAAEPRRGDYEANS